MPRKSTADVALEEQAQWAEATRRKSAAELEDEEPEPRRCDGCGATEGVPDPRCEDECLCPTCVDGADAAEDNHAAPAEVGGFAADDTHTERTDRLVRRPFTDVQKAEYVEQLTTSTIRIKELQDEKRAVSKDFNDRISGRQQEAIAAAKALTEDGTHEMTACECIWDLASRTYTERTIDSGYVVTERPLTPEEIERFQQMHLPGLERPKGSWLGWGERVPEDSGDDEDDDDEEDEDDLDDELEDEDDPDAA